MPKFSLSSLKFWNKSSQEFNTSGSFFEKKVTPQLNLDFDIQSDFVTLPSYVKVDPDEKLKQQNAGYFQLLVQDAPSIPLDSEFQVKPPPWIDADLLKEGLGFIHSHFYAIFFAHIISIFLVFTVRPLQALILRTTAFHNTNSEDGAPSASLVCMLKTILNIRSIYQHLDPNCKEMDNVEIWMKEASQTFRKFLPPLSTELSLNGEETLEFRKLRKELEQKCPATEELKRVEKIRTTLNPEVPLSQYDLSVLQFTFFSLPILYPNSFGLSSWKEKDVRAFSHVWAVIGYSVGLKDEFNLAFHHGSQERSVWTNSAAEVHSKIFKFSFSQIDTMTYKLWLILESDLKQIWLWWVLIVNLQGILHFVSKHIFQIRLTHLTWKSKFSYYIYRVLAQSSKCWVSRIILNFALRRILTFANWFYINRHRVQERQKNEMHASRISLTRSIRWSAGADGIEFETV